ncbi:WD repeat domain phosphoinositide-interacting protein 2 [Eurytemora carolleeae]|uniref:WD repeat domain phosphoinositide-interacting protein 2 n=1 Tax=Eurytemora carolleeae TaxID=1294199 RepID=UPI000C75DE3F|nr:WD repeat domain phosphoinositide-interacting protein 2 [Eurytemora carolleeae]|eukprot:XP_023328366.1 WD repeat domain phosphoinositide-interacting protein 2-like [Eurytemora affinis]
MAFTDPSLEVNFINFNQDCTSLALGTRTGYKLFSLNSIEKLDLIYESPCRDVTIVERLFSSSLIALVSQSSPRRLRVCHFKKGTEICQYSYSNTILAVKLNRARLVVCLEEALYIHNIRDMKVLHTIRETPSNPRGLCALSINSDNCILAYPGSTTSGEVQLFDAFNLQAKLMIPAHDAPLAALSFNPSGSRLASASVRGTVIRIFNVVDGTRLIEFRRGVKRCALVYSLAFSQDSQFLALASNTETIHIFRVEEGHQQQEENHQKQTNIHPTEDGSWMGYLSKAVSVSASYLPTQVTDTLNQFRAFATVTVPSAGVPNIVSIATLSRQIRLLMASMDGYFYVYNIPVEGGECTMIKQHKLDTECTIQDVDGKDCKGEEGGGGGDKTYSPPDSPAVIPVTQVRTEKTCKLVFFKLLFLL